MRDHFAPAAVHLDEWRLRIEGRVAKPFELSFSDLVESPSITLEAVMECAGNLANGSAVSNGIWEGVPLSALLDRTRPTKEAAFLMLEGADSGRLIEKAPVLPYSQLVPIEKGAEASSMVAYKLNDLALPMRNGFPARALFLGWYGMDSVKWLRRIVVLSAEDREAAFYKSGMTSLYNRVVRSGSAESVTRLSTVQVKSAIAWPNENSRLPAGRHVIWGFAWTGTSGIRDVAITLDGGKEWKPTRLEGAASSYGWVRWSYNWEAKTGDHTLMSRASDRLGNRQPVKRDAGRKDQYELNWCLPIQCIVR